MFAHLHTHTEYSLLDGLSKIPDLVARASEMEQQALAITDHGALHGAIEFYEAATAAGVKPIIGIEAYVAPGSRFEKDPQQRWPYHLTLLAQNEVGLPQSAAAQQSGPPRGVLLPPEDGPRATRGALGRLDRAQRLPLRRADDRVARG